MTIPIERPPGGLQPERLEAGSGGPRAGGRRRSVARLAAVQALYQLELNREVDPEVVVREFGRHRLGHEIDGDRYGEADPALSEALTEEWPLPLFDAVLRAILRAGAYELVHRRDVPPRVSINEYTTIAHAFFSGKEPGLANGVLDKLGRTLRAAEM
jgi:transcription antitermination protein NusB